MAANAPSTTAYWITTAVAVAGALIALYNLWKTRQDRRPRLHISLRKTYDKSTGTDRPCTEVSLVNLSDRLISARAVTLTTSSHDHLSHWDMDPPQSRWPIPIQPGETVTVKIFYPDWDAVAAWVTDTTWSRHRGSEYDRRRTRMQVGRVRGALDRAWIRRMRKAAAEETARLADNSATRPKK